MSTLNPSTEKKDPEDVLDGLEAGGDNTSDIPSFTALVEEGEIPINPMC
jgi:hypothetical protein